MKKRILALLLAALLVLALAACGEKTPAETTPAETASSEAARPEDAPKGPPMQTLTNDGMNLLIPEEYMDILTVETPAAGGEGDLFLVSEKASVEAGKKQGHDASFGDGWLFGIRRVGEEEMKQMRCGDHSGSEFFAKDANGSYYVYTHPTDVRIAREGEITEEDMKQWSTLNEWAWSAVRDTFIAENDGLEPVSFGNSEMDIVFARIAFQKDLKYTVSTLEYGPLEPKDVDPAPYLEKLMSGVTYEYSDEQAPDGEYVVLTFPDEGVRYDFFIGEAEKNLVRRVYDDTSIDPLLYKATFADGTTKITEVMQDWYNALAAANGKTAG